MIRLRTWQRIGTLILSLAALDCQRNERPTQIVLHIDSQLRAGVEVQAIVVRARRAANGPVVFQRDFSLVNSSFRLPGEVGLYASNANDSGPVYIDLSVQLTQGGSFSVQAESRFVPREVRVVPVLLSLDCASRAAMTPGGTCAASCSACGCSPVLVDSDGGQPGGQYVDPLGPEQDTEARCQLARPPPIPPDLPNPPTPPTDGGTGSGFCQRGPCFAVRALRFDWPTDANPNGWQTHGWDLDGICTSMSRAIPTCRNPSGVVVDGLNGRDNAFASRLGPYLQSVMNISEQRINENVEAGVASMGIELRGYAGTGDDGTVEVVFFPISQGRAGDGSMPPRWDGNDIWSVDRYIVVSPEDAISRGYVAGSRIVLRLRSQTPLAFATEFGQSRFLVSGGIASGTVHCGGRQLGPIELGGFVEVRQLTNDLPLLGLCSPLERLAVATALAQSADLNVVGDVPVNNANVDCNAISFGVTLVPVPIRAIEGEVNAGVRPNPCLPDSGTSPSDASAEAGADASSDGSFDAAVDARG
jgi:hypothetical protein